MKKLREKIDKLSNKRLKAVIIIFLISALIFLAIGWYLTFKEAYARGVICIVIGLFNLYIWAEACTSNSCQKNRKESQEKLSSLLSTTEFTEVKFSPYLYYSSKDLYYEYRKYNLKKCSKMLEQVNYTYWAKLDENGNVYVVTKLNGEFFDDETIEDLNYFIGNYVFFK